MKLRQEVLFWFVCILLLPVFIDSVQQKSAAWDESELRALEGILNITPDLLPCDLAVLCRKPCREASRALGLSPASH